MPTSFLPNRIGASNVVNSSASARIAFRGGRDDRRRECPLSGLAATFQIRPQPLAKRLEVAANRRRRPAVADP